MKANNDVQGPDRDAKGKSASVAAEEALLRDEDAGADVDADVEFETFVPEEIPKELRKALEPLVLEYFNSQDMDDFIENFLEVDKSAQGRVAAAAIAVEKALEARNKERELVSKLLVKMSEDAVKEALLVKAFDLLLASVDDLALDVPEAPTHLAHFIGRALSDEVLPPRFLAEHKDLSNPKADEIVRTANTLVNMRHGMAFLDNIWGHNSGALTHLTENITSTLKEYLQSGDVKEAEKQLKDLGVPHFHHEVVYEAVVMALEKTSNSERRRELLSKLLQTLAKSFFISENQIVVGFSRVKRNINDIAVDIPGAVAAFDAFADRATAAGYLPKGSLDAVQPLEAAA
eukprot:comp19331_c0_seq1/m.22240 comp19331_c0_seq1/g.22240  ORF comp19331_c0_seq1/g.22240 comp19331_c0_seq1/m.22240 type:complete len:346 (-) comp19331_c0_seq1:631-1668(-)